MKIIYYCPQCNNAFGGEAGIQQECPNCRTELLQTDIERDRWRLLSDSEKNNFKNKWKIQSDEVRKEKELRKKQNDDYIRRYNNHMITTGYNFEGYRIISYLDVVCGESVLGTGLFSSTSAGIADLFGLESTGYQSKLQQARDNAKRKAIHNSATLGGNALIGVDIDYINFSSDIIGVIYNGTSVIIEKIKE